MHAGFRVACVVFVCLCTCVWSVYFSVSCRFVAGPSVCACLSVLDHVSALMTVQKF